MLPERVRRSGEIEIGTPGKLGVVCISKYVCSGGCHGRGAGPAGAYNVGAQLIAKETAVDGHPAWARVDLREGVWLSLRAARIAGRDGHGGDIAVTIETASAVERMGVFARAYGISRRRTELVTALAGGSDTRQLAAELFISENTVQDHLKSIFGKTGAPNQRVLIARALGG